MAVLDDIREGKGLKPITFNCFTCQNDNCIASGEKTATYQCPGYKHKNTNADCIRSMTNEEDDYIKKEIMMEYPELIEKASEDLKSTIQENVDMIRNMDDEHLINFFMKLIQGIRKQAFEEVKMTLDAMEEYG